MSAATATRRSRRDRWGDAVRRHVVSQFRHPRGLLGRLAGAVLARRPSNRARNRWAVELLDLEPHHHVLELGHGPGLALRDCTARVPEGRVVGVDHSETMRRMAARRNARAVADGRLQLHVASFDALPDLGGRFDRILAVNAVGFAGDPDALLADLADRLRPGGRIAVVFQSRRAGATDADSERGGRDLAAALARAGLVNVRVETLPLEPVAAVCALGEHSGGAAG